MKLADQIIDSQGRVPVTGARCKVGSTLEESIIEFFLQRPEEKTGKVANAGGASEQAAVEDIAFLCDGDGKIDRLLLEKLAARMGPLFGANREESALDWAAESAFVRDVMEMQEVVNGCGTFDRLDDPGAGASLVAKSEIKNNATGSRFVLYTYEAQLGVLADGNLIRALPEFPVFAKASVGNGFDYAFAQLEDVGGGKVALSATLFSFKHEISALDFAAVLDSVGIDRDDAYKDNLVSKAARELCFSGDCPAALRRNVGGDVEAKPRRLGVEDAPHLQKLIYFLVSLNLKKISIDLFRVSGSDGYMVFPNRLSYLWYGFMKSRDQVKIGVCEVCGKGFSLAGHRGIERRFCSEACKTKAKNARTRVRRDKARALFLEGAEVDDIARVLYKDELSENAKAPKRKTFEQARAAIVRSIATYPKVKRMIEDDLHCGDGSFAKRCLAEGIAFANQIGQL